MIQEHRRAISTTVWGLRADIFVNILGPIMGLRGVATIRKILLGYFEGRNVTEVRANAKVRFRRHYAEVRAAVPSERVLEFKLEDRWGPYVSFSVRRCLKCPSRD